MEGLDSPIIKESIENRIGNANPNIRLWIAEGFCYTFFGKQPSQFNQFFQKLFFGFKYENIK